MRHIVKAVQAVNSDRCKPRRRVRADRSRVELDAVGDGSPAIVEAPKQDEREV
jgi:hypothetical protein